MKHVVVEIGGTSVSGIDVGEEYIKKFATAGNIGTANTTRMPSLLSKI